VIFGVIRKKENLLVILYKYYGYESGLKALHSSNLGFRTPYHFNDPFELSFLSNSEGPRSKQAELISKLDELRNTVVILSLTRTPYNPLMWAHYGQEHTGFVVGYDVSDEFLSSSKYNLIPVISGDVIYTYTKNSHMLDLDIMYRIRDIYLSSMGDATKIMDQKTLSFSRKIFLTKHASWVYEEEVRAVKILSRDDVHVNNSQNDERRSHSLLESIPGLSIFDFKVPIKEIYLGLRNPLITGRNEVGFMKKEDRRIYMLTMDEKSWNLKSREIYV
jgi:hypothetical protein